MEMKLIVEPPAKIKIKIIGVGGAGGNAVNTMIKSNIKGVEYVVANTDAQDLNKSMAETKVILGNKLTKGLGAGADPEVGRLAAEESIDDIADAIFDANMLFISAGMGGGTGTGAAPVIARKAKELGILTLGVVSMPFDHEGTSRKDNATKGMSDLREVVDTLIVIPNSKIPKIYGRLTVVDALKRTDEIITNAAETISDIINSSGLINVDFADVKRVMSDAGDGLIGGGVASGEDRVAQAVKNAIENPLLSDIDLSGCKGLLINISAGNDYMMDEFDQVNEMITNETGKQGVIVSGLRIDEKMEGQIKVTIIAAGLNSGEPVIREPKPLPIPEKIQTISTTFPVNKSEEPTIKMNDDKELHIQELKDIRRRIDDANPISELPLNAKPYNTTDFKQGEPPAFMKKYFN